MTETRAPLQEIPGELPADRRAREARRRRSVTYVGRGSNRRRQIQQDHGHTRPLVEQNGGRIVSVTLVRHAESED